MNEKQQTSLQWLMEQFSEKSRKIMYWPFAAALRKESEQIQRAYAAGWEDGVTWSLCEKPKYQTGKQYFDDTYQEKP